MRPRNIFLVVLVGLYSWAGAVVVWTLNLEASPSIDYGQRLAALCASQQPPGENGWPHLAAATAVFEELHADIDARQGGTARFLDDYPEFDFSIFTDHEPSPEAVDAVLETIAELEARGAFGHIARASRCPNIVRPRPGPDELLWADELPIDGPLTTLLEARRLSIEVALARGAADEAQQALSDVLAVAQALSYEPGPGHLTGEFLALSVLAQVPGAVEYHRPEAGTLRGWLTALERFELAPPALVIEGDHLRSLDLIQHVYSDNGFGSGRFLVNELFAGSREPRPLGNLTTYLYASRRQVRRRTNEHYETLQRMAHAGELENGTARELAESVSWRYPAPRLLDGFSSYTELGTRTLAKLHRRVILIVALEVAREERGAYPDALEELVPGVLAALPAHPESSGGTHYRRLPESAEYILYRGGPNGVDDGGSGDDIAVGFESSYGAGFRAALRQMRITQQPLD